ncbi:MAG: hypothetical protein V1921_05420 [Candidatus Altiarchaeota archaeon]
MTLQAKKKTKKEQKSGNVTLILILLVVFLMGSVGVAVSVAAYVASKAENDPQSQVRTYTTSTSVTSTSTSIVSTSTVYVMTSVPTTTSVRPTTTVCGGLGEEACRNSGECQKGLVRNSGGICVDPNCAPSVASGREGCGEFALNFCRGG